MKRFFYLFILILMVFSSTAIAQATRPPMPPGFPRAPIPEEHAASKAKDLQRVSSFGNNIIRVIPLEILDEENFAFGLSYERLLGKKRRFGLLLPISFSNNPEADVSGSVSFYNATEHSYVLLTPSVKYYPFGPRVVTYAVGPTYYIRRGSQTFRRGNQRLQTKYKEQQLQMGLLVNNYLNVQIGPNLNFGLELGLGSRFLNKALTPEKKNYGQDFMRSIAFSLGLRF